MDVQLGMPLLDEELPDVVEVPHDDALHVDPAFEVELELHGPSSIHRPRKSDETAKSSKKLMKRQNKHVHRDRKE